MSWRDRAACAGRTKPADDLPGLSVRQRREVARWYCLECPVVRECAADALDRGDIGVIRGGLWLSPASSRQSKMTRRALAAVAEGPA